MDSRGRLYHHQEDRGLHMALVDSFAVSVFNTNNGIKITSSNYEVVESDIW